MNLTKDFFNLVLDFGEDWVVKDVEVDHKQLRVYLYLEYCCGYYEDPQTNEQAVLYDHTELREWRHLDILQYQTYVRCRIPRVKGKDGIVRQIAISWAHKYDRHTYLFEIKAIDLLMATKNQTKTAELLGCGFRLINRIMHRSVERGLSNRDLSKLPIEHISIDEKSFQRGHSYVTVLSHPRSGAVINVSHGRDSQSARNILRSAFTPEQLDNIRTISMDMWQPYLNAAEECCAQAEIVHDKFHLVSYLNKGIDQVRRREVKQNPALKGSRYSLLKNEVNMTVNQRELFEQIKASNFQVSQVWHIRENFKELFGRTHNEKDALELLKNWATDSFRKGISEVNKIILMFLNHATGLINALISNLNNAMAERLNGKIQEIKFIAKGYRRFENFRSAILFFHGGLSLYPRKW